MLLSRRLYPEARSFKLGSLAAFHALPPSGRAHRALADAEMAAALLEKICRDLKQRYGLGPLQHAWLMALQRSPRQKLDAAVARLMPA
jgi:DNA polymerase-3 subunit epsilon